MEKLLIILTILLILFIVYKPAASSGFVPAPMLPIYNLDGSPYLTYDTEGAFNIGNQSKVYYST